MPYFFILSIFVLWLVGLLVGAVIVRYSARLRPLSTYLIAVAIGSVPGFLLGNVALLVGALGVAKLLTLFSLPRILQPLQTLGAAATIFIGPFIASAIGILLGAFLGIVVAWRRQRHKPA
ncbi:hypothetical protein [Hymenobacter sp. HDW8]|uniref:hypothetical protein n=1 Tax=Hymenobacter sp. HDW8 TaxID=2714932 RepID=UPI001407ED02|nr:hypothetical protein [Hymenobacter sp. HDW8]QIL77194.1 hypothetical protein G7064_16070 [Hymenobacter sp. HDW8]